MIFEKLTPNNSADISGYKEALDFALKGNMDITNVALTGTYGSGKSSILETYEKNSDLSYLHISLAHYDNADGIDTKNLERKIINQLLHQVEKKRIPKTVFKVKENRSAFSIVNVSVLIVLWIVFIVSIINFKKTKNIISEILNVTLGREFLASWIILGLVLSISLLYKFIKIQDSRNMLKSLSFFGNKIEILEETDDSYFDKFMNDVIYLFINSGADVIVFEDLDRFNDVTIYEKLQEINILLNRNLNIKNTDRKITFLYLLRDDTLISKDRTKFFDFIVPVVPVMDSSNSYEKLIDVLKDAKVEEGLDRNVLKKLTLYIDDFRLLKNIVNEYMIYNHRLSMNKSDNYLNSNKLLGIIVYKNLFPKDFALLQYGRSFINFVFSEKENILDNKRKEIRKNLDMLGDRIKASKQENLQSIDELDALYITFEDEKSIKVDGRSVDDFSSRIKFIEAIREKNYEVERIGYSNKYNLFNKLKENHDYIQRREILQDKNKQEKLNKEKIKLEKELRKVDELWSEVLHNKNLEFWEELVEKKEEFRYLQGNEYFNLLVVMLRDELIDEKYSDYIAYFYEGNLLYSDKKFIRSIFDKGNVGYDYRIEDPKKVIEYITDKDYRRYKILNIDLSAYLIKKGSERYRKALVDIIEENKEYSFLLTLLRRIDESEEIIELFSILSDNQPKMTENIIQSSDIDVSDKIYYMTKYICFAATEDIQNNIEDKVLRDFISANPNFLSSKDIISKRFLEKLEILGKKGVKFPDISNTERNIIEGILNKKVFEINKVNLRAILRFYNIDDTKKEFKNRNYTYFKESLQGKGDDILSFLYENNNIGKYIETYLSLSKLELEDETEDVLKILNDKQVGSDLKKEYIDRLSASVKIPKISDVREKELREKLFIHGNVEESGENIVEAFKQNGEEKDREDELEIDIELISAVVGYINSFKGKVDIEKKLLSSSQTDKLFDAFVVNIELHDDKYIELLKSLNLVYTQGIDSSIPESRIPLLIKNGIISFTSDNLQDMRDNHSDYLVQYIYYNFEKYISIKEDDLLLNDRELESLLQSGLFSLNQEKKIVDNLQNGISIEFEYSDTVKAYILEKAYDENDLKYIVEKFSELGQLSQKVAYRIISTRGLQELTDGEVKPEKSLLMKLLYDSNIENDDRKWIFVNNLKRLSVEEADKQIHNLELPTGFSKALHRGRPRVEKNSLNKEIAEQFQKLEWVTTVTEKGNELYIIGRKMV